MNGMTRKARRRYHRLRFTAEGIPRDANEWTEEDWKTLYRFMEAVKDKVAENHERDCRDSQRGGA